MLELQYPTISHDIKDEIKKLLYATGTLFICAKSEADTLLAYWYRRNIIDAVLSYDYDFIARGCKLLIPMQTQAQSQWDKWETYDPQIIRTALGLNEERFIDLCVLIGSDYTPDLPIVPWKTALQGLKSNQPIETIWSRHTFTNWRDPNVKERMKNEMEMFNRAKCILNGTGDLPECMMEDLQWEKWNAGNQNPEVLSLNLFRKIYPDWNSEWWELFMNGQAF
jgi:5'-3' exonuclease